MNIQPKKFYRLRDGRKYYVAVVDKPGTYPIVGWLDGADSVSMRYADGRCSQNELHNGDIVEEWHEIPDVPWDKLFPPWVKWFAIDAAGRQWGFSHRPLLTSSGWAKQDASKPQPCPVPEALAVKFVDRWSMSLVERPKTA